MNLSLEFGVESVELRVWSWSSVAMMEYCRKVYKLTLDFD
jgi:hypothetical protein